MNALKNDFFSKENLTAVCFFVMTALYVSPAQAADPQANKICIQNGGGFAMKAQIQWGNGVTAETDNYTNPNTKCIDLMPYFQSGKLQEGTSMWASANILAGPNDKRSSENVTFSSTANATVTYTITGTTLKSSFHRQ